MKKVISILMCIMLIMAWNPLSVVGSDTITVDIPMTLDFENATGIDLNIRLNPLFVDKAEMVNVASSIDNNVSYLMNQNGVKVKISIASATPINHQGILFTLRLSLKQAVGVDDELCKLLQIKVNEKITWQADDCILLSGVSTGGHYNRDIEIGFNEGSATLNGVAFDSGSTISAEGEYSLVITDLNGKVRTTAFVIDKTAPVITIASYETKPVQAPFTVYASVNEGELNESSHTFFGNGSFTFVATDKAGNKSEKTVTISHLIEYMIGDLDGDDNLDSDDAIYLLFHTFDSVKYPVIQDCDYDKDGNVDSDDAIYLLFHTFNPEKYPI